MMPSADFHSLAATDLLIGYARRDFSPVEVMRAILARVETVNPKINALFHIRTEDVLAEAQASEARWMRTAPQGLLDGVPVTIKDSIAAAGMPYWRGTRGNRGNPLSRYDSPPAARLREAGALIFAKATMPDFGMFGAGVSTAHGITRNPWNTDFNTGGSSSGGAAAVAARLGPLTVGSDIGGSVRIPAAFCGLAAIKPTQGRIPHLPPSPIRSAGPLTRTVRDTALLLSVLSGADARDYGSLPPGHPPYHEQLAGGVSGLRLGLLLDLGFGAPPEPAVEQAIRQAAAVLEAQGATIVILPPLVNADPMPFIRLIFDVRSRIEFESMSPEAQAQVHPAIRAQCMALAEVSALDLSRAFDRVEVMKAEALAVTAQVDYVLAPTTGVAGFPAEALAPDPADILGVATWTAAFNQTGQPAAVVRAGFDERGLPIGLQVIGPRHDDLGVLRVAAAYEAAAEPGLPWPDPV
jgi:amidase/aspartyl-tRNA(Asn)/glutamyl-tRNA(Gln) amidotransferase subunit A